MERGGASCCGLPWSGGEARRRRTPFGLLFQVSELPRLPGYHNACRRAWRASCQRPSQFVHITNPNHAQPPCGPAALGAVWCGSDFAYAAFALLLARLLADCTFTHLTTAPRNVPS